VVGYIAIFLFATGGLAQALPGKNSVDSGDIEKGQVKSADVRNNGVKGIDLRDEGVTGRDVAEGTLGAVPAALNAQRADMAQHADSAQTAEQATNADQLDGRDGSGYLIWGSPIPSGITVRGVFMGWEQGTGASTFQTSESFPAPAPANLQNSDVNFHPTDHANDDDPSCTGSATSPTAPPGKVCIYPSAGGPVNGDAHGVAMLPGTEGSRFGFQINGQTGPSGAAMNGTWAYTAP
jgi:hypothetical protein